MNTELLVGGYVAMWVLTSLWFVLSTEETGDPADDIAGVFIGGVWPVILPALLLVVVSNTWRRRGEPK